MNTNNHESKEKVNFIQAIIDQDKEKNKYNGRIHLRFPPEPNGYLHIGHAKSICLNFGLAEKNNGLCNLRFDDTNPSKEDTEYINSIIRDVKWLGYDWGDRLFYASDYFARMYEDAVSLIKQDKAHVCDLSPDDIREYRGTFIKTGENS
ncbi:MAG: glutamate--tRNA ligase family protein, partial [Atribacterota bacterium]|nr:glutamate--tRNA ligase family protein [Atribacterota bacterium]